MSILRFGRVDNGELFAVEGRPEGRVAPTDELEPGRRKHRLAHLTAVQGFLTFDFSESFSSRIGFRSAIGTAGF